MEKEPWAPEKNLVHNAKFVGRSNTCTTTPIYMRCLGIADYYLYGEKNLGLFTANT